MTEDEQRQELLAALRQHGEWRDQPDEGPEEEDDPERPLSRMRVRATHPSQTMVRS